MEYPSTANPATTVVPSLPSLYDSTAIVLVLSPKDNATVLRLTEIKQAIFASYFWAVFLLGFPGNVACVLTVMSMSKLSTATLYVAFLAVVDALTLLLKLIYHQLAFHQAYLGDHGCKVSVLTSILNCYANWVLVLVCFERFLAVCWPLKKAVFFTKSRAWIIAAVLFALIFLIYSQLFVLYISDPTGRFCGFNGSVGRYVRVWYWFSAVLFSFAPFVLLVIFTTMIITGLRRFRTARKSIVKGDNQRHSKAKGGKRGGENVERSISVMMAVAALVFLLLTLPNCIFVICFDPWHQYPPVTHARWMIFQQVAYIFVDLNHAINFYLYFLTAGKFRAQFRNMICCRTRHLRKKNESTSFVDHTQYTRANSSECLPMAKV
ncbi:thyrotropin-releasing hormone receptor-like [Babylonia areolata]|uniref:thyrotropin-releasing hormone receptor-like n=1 Tax=Babylonia areolata TaxID=304850 RepID=UPI003FD21F88